MITWIGKGLWQKVARREIISPYSFVDGSIGRLSFTIEDILRLLHQGMLTSLLEHTLSFAVKSLEAPVDRLSHETGLHEPLFHPKIRIGNSILETGISTRRAHDSR